MKKLSFAVAMIVSALVIGCQDSNMTNPLSNDFSGKKAPVFSRPNASLPDGSYDFKQHLSVGPIEAVDNTFEVSGTIQYILVETGDEGYELALVTQGVAQSVHRKDINGTIYGESMDYVTFNGKEPARIEKAYVIQGLETFVSLHVAFMVSDSEVTVERMWLSEDGSLGKLVN